MLIRTDAAGMSGVVWGQPGVAVILKCRELERIAIFLTKTNRMAVERRYVNQPTKLVTILPGA
jgi:hypothetical protein